MDEVRGDDFLVGVADPLVSTRSWQNVLDEIIAIKTGPTQTRWKSAAKDKAFIPLLSRVLIETQAEHLLAVLRAGTVSTNAFLRKVHNFAVDMNWLPATVIPRRQWPAIHYKEKRAIIQHYQRMSSYLRDTTLVGVASSLKPSRWTNASRNESHPKLPQGRALRTLGMAGVLFLMFACFCDPKCFPDTFNKRFGVFPRAKMSAL